MMLEKASYGDHNNNKEIHQYLLDFYSPKQSPHHPKPLHIHLTQSEED